MKIPKVILRIETSRACGRGILRGISRYCRSFGRWRLSQALPFYLYPQSGGEDPAGPESWMADGMIVSRPDIPQYVMEMRLPVIGIDVQKPTLGIPNIMGDNEAIAAMAFEYFIERGFSTFAYCGFEGIGWSIERGERFAARANEKGYDVFVHQIKHLDVRTTWDNEIDAIGSWLKHLPHPIAVPACNDDCSKLVSAACESVGLRVPEEVAILGVDNDEMICTLNDPPLSSIVLDFEKAGFEAASLLDRIMKGKAALACQRVVIQPTHIVTRPSTDVLAINDPDVASALQFIRSRAHEPIGVPDVVEAASKSRRGLEYKFQAVLGKSIWKIIRKQRVYRIETLLIETKLSISQIASKLGFSDPVNMSRYFKGEKGLCPVNYRKKFGIL